MTQSILILINKKFENKQLCLLSAKRYVQILLLLLSNNNNNMNHNHNHNTHYHHNHNK